MLNFSLGEDMTLGMYYEKFNTRVAIAESAGCTFMMETLLDTEAELLYPGTTYKSLLATEKAQNLARNLARKSCDRTGLIRGYLRK